MEMSSKLEGENVSKKFSAELDVHKIDPWKSNIISYFH
jgi:hypothetical protein